MNEPTDNFALANTSQDGKWMYLSDSHAPFTESMKAACHAASEGFEHVVKPIDAGWRHGRRAAYLFVEATDAGVTAGAQLMREYLIRERCTRLLKAHGIGIAPLARRSTPPDSIDVRRLGLDWTDENRIEFADDPRRYVLMGCYYKTEADS